MFVAGGGGGGRTHSLLALVVWPLTTRPLRDGASFLLIIETPPTFRRSLRFFHTLHRNLLHILSPYCFAVYAHHLGVSNKQGGVKTIQKAYFSSYRRVVPETRRKKLSESRYGCRGEWKLRKPCQQLGEQQRRSLTDLHLTKNCRRRFEWQAGNARGQRP